MTAAAAVPTASRGASREHGVTLWGAPGAGKSGVLGALYAASLHPELDAWTAHPKDCEDVVTQERLHEAYLGLRGRTNTKTGLPAAGSEYPPLRVMLRRQRGGRADSALRVALVDPAGEFSTRLELGATPEGRALFRRVATGAGVVWLVDATPHADAAATGAGRTRAPGSGQAVEERLLTLQHLVALIEHGGGEQLAIPVALCLSKIDALDDEARAAARLDPATALRERMGETAFTWFEAACPTLRCFALSSTGSVVGRVQPEGLDALFDWLASVAQPKPSIGESVRDVIRSPRATAVQASAARLRSLLRGRTAVVALAAIALGVSGTIAARRAPGLAQAVSAFVAMRLGRGGAAGDGAGDAAGDAASTTSPARSPLGTAQAAERLARARREAGRGAWDEAVSALGDEVPPDAMRFAWDSLYVTAAVAAASATPNGGTAQRLREGARTRATALVRRGPAGSRRLVAVRYARGVACVDGGLACPRADIVADLTWALLGPPSMRRGAQRRLDALANAPAGDAGTGAPERVPNGPRTPLLSVKAGS